MAPMLAGILRRIGLIKKMPAPLPETESVGIVQGPLGIHVMVDRPMGIGSELAARLVHPLQQRGPGHAGIATFEFTL